jgi:hypothetical protein
MIPPSLSTNSNGNVILSVAQYCVYNYELPNINSFINVNHYNGFIVYRSILHKELRGKSTKEISQIASETWGIADMDFRLFFNNYANKINKIVKKHISPKFKLFEVKTKRKCKVLNKQSKYLHVEQEEIMRKIYEKEVKEFNFVSF